MPHSVRPPHASLVRVERIFWSEQLPGFILETRSSGAATYYFRYQDAHGKQRAFKIGGRADVSYETARKAAQRLRSEVVLGGDPATEKEAKRAIPTYASLAADHLAHAKGVMKSYGSLETMMRLHILPRWGRCRLTEITAQAVSKWLVDKSDEGLAPATIEKIRVMFGRSFELGRRWSVPGSETNPARGLSRPKFANRRERFLTAEEAIRRSSVFALDGGAFFRSHEQGAERHLFCQVDGPLGDRASRAECLDLGMASGLNGILVRARGEAR